MRQVTLVFLASVLCISIFLVPVTATAAEGIGSGLVLKAGFGCKMQDGKLVCGKTKKSDDDNDDDDDDDDKPKKSKDKVIPKTCGKKVNCEAGFVKLEKPNKYGACCEAREGLPPPKPQQADKCQFPGEVGTPPNCTCPPGTEFMGYKGCLPKKAEPPAKKGGSYCSQEVPESMVPLAKQTCTNNHPGGWLNCSIPKPGFVICCCNWL